MASTCIDKNDQTTINGLSVSSSPTTNSNGEYTLNQISLFAKELADNIVAEKESNPILIAQNKYGDSFYKSVNYTNKEFLVNKDLTKYPKLQERLNQGQITPIELADFLTLFNLTPNGVIAKGTLWPDNLLFELERYYANDIKFGSLGGICSIFESVFVNVDGFFNAIGVIQGFINDAFTFIAKIKSYSNSPEDRAVAAAEAITVQELITKIGEFISDEVDQMLKAVSLMFENFSISDIIGNVNHRIKLSTIRTIMKCKDEACLLTSEENKQTIRNKINGLFSYAVGLYENPGVAEIQFLITRVCALISNVRALLLDFKSPMDQFEFKYKRISNRLKTISNITSSTAIRNGAIRFSEDAKLENINSINTSWEDNGDVSYTPTGKKANNVKEPNIQEYSDLPSCSDVRNGKDSRIEVDSNSFWVKDFGMEGWTGLDFDLRVYLMRFSDLVGVKLILKRGWISQQYNSKIGGDPDSIYMSGKTVSISTENIFYLDTIPDYAIRSGFKFVKIDKVNNLIHLDTRPLIG
jgi:hypothetical protein